MTQRCRDDPSGNDGKITATSDDIAGGTEREREWRARFNKRSNKEDVLPESHRRGVCADVKKWKNTHRGV